MQIALVGLGLFSCVQLLLWTPPLWRFRAALSVGASAGVSLFTTVLLVQNLSVWTVLVALLTVYRLVNYRRIYLSRIQSSYLFSVSLKTELCLVGLQLFITTISISLQPLQWALPTWWYSLAAFQLFALASLSLSLWQQNKRSKPATIAEAYADKDLPTVTVAIPARNETTDLHDCLKSVLATDYPKLEIIVLDDCSQSKRTPEIIRDFAQSGVRFIAGKEPPESWLAKNYAYQQLYEVSNGDILLFCGVDIRFAPQTMRALVTQLVSRKQAMLSLLPINASPRTGWQAYLVQPLRYAWEITLPRRRFGRPPVLSSCWLIQREAMQASGGFAAARRMIVPESYFAREIAKHTDDYMFVYADQTLAVHSNKPLAEQRATAIRTRYPQLHRRPELVFLITLGVFTLFVWPVIMFGAALLTTSWLLAALSGASLIIAAFLFHSLVHLTFRRRIWRAVMLAPVGALYDMWLLNYSMWQYEFGSVIWKGRNVCLPVMHVPLETQAKGLAQK